MLIQLKVVGGEKMRLSKNQLLALKRKKGERSLKIYDLANEIGISRFTISRILNNGVKENITSTTAQKINNWLIKQYNHDLASCLNKSD